MTAPLNSSSFPPQAQLLLDRQQNIQGTLDKLGAQESKLLTQQENIQTRLGNANLSADVQARLEDRLGNVQTKLDGLQSRLGSLGDRLQNIITRLLEKFGIGEGRQVGGR